MYNMENYNSSKVAQQQQQQYQDECDRPLSSDDWYQWMQNSSDGICPVIENDKQNSEMKSEIAVSENQYLGGDWPEYVYDGGQNNKMSWEDEFSMNSMLKDDMDVPQMSLGDENECSSARLDKMFDDMVVDSQSKCTDQSDLGSSKYMKHDYPQSRYWNKLDETSHFMVSNTDQTKATMDTKEPVKTSAEQEEDVDEEVSGKASELQDLEDVMTQLTSETRIFFRDALYRLANNSKQQQQSQNQNRCGEDYKPQASTIHQENSMYGRSDNMELETNIIDRTVAKLMFNEMNCNETDDFCVDSVDFSDASFTAASSFNNNYDQSVQCHNSN
ncbi:hypothetical protein MKX01_017502 [Papaver californicum]|nr:hypothetical protein MKX01_017502 [Papaver californicum]